MCESAWKWQSNNPYGYEDGPSQESGSWIQSLHLLLVFVLNFQEQGRLGQFYHTNQLKASECRHLYETTCSL